MKKSIMIEQGWAVRPWRFRTTERLNIFKTNDHISSQTGHVCLAVCLSGHVCVCVCVLSIQTRPRVNSCIKNIVAILL